MDALGKLAELQALLHGGRRVGGRTLVDGTALAGGLAQVQDLVTAEVREARAVLQEREAMMAAGRREIEQLRTEVAAERAVRITDAEVSAESQQILSEARDFAERSLAELEAVLQRVLSAITRARTALETEGSVLGARELRQTLQPAE